MTNHWKTASIILGIIALCLLANVIKQKFNPEIYDFGEGFEISKVDFDALTSKFPENQTELELCNLKENKCVKIERLR